MDKISIQIIRRVNPDGSGGTVVEHLSALLGQAEGQSALELALDAFAHTPGLHRVPAPTADDPQATEPLSRERNLLYHMRRYVDNQVDGYTAALRRQQDADALRVAREARETATAIVDELAGDLVG